MADEVDADPIGRLMALREELGEFMGIRFGLLRGSPTWMYVPHRECDGIGAFATLLLKHGMPCGAELPSASRGPAMNAAPSAPPREEVATRSAAWPQLGVPLPWPPTKAGPPTNIAWLVFSHDETQSIAARAKSAGVTVTTLLLWGIHHVVFPLLSDPEYPAIWTMPFNLRGLIDWNGPATANQMGMVGVTLASTASLQQVQAAIREIQSSGRHVAAYTGMRTLFSTSRDECVATLKKRTNERRVGSFSNLGVWPQAGVDPTCADDARWLFAPPITDRSPVGVGCLTWRGELTLTVHVHDGLGFDRNTLDGWLCQWRELILSSPLATSSAAP